MALDGFVRRLSIRLFAAVLAVVLPQQAYSDGNATLASALQNIPATRNKQKLSNGYQKAWAGVATACPSTTSNAMSTDCPQAAISLAMSECATSAQLFKKDSKVWTWLGFGLMIASGAFTAVGASTTVVNAKIWSTLGGTTGLGAATATINSNTTADAAGANLVFQTIAAFGAFLSTGTVNFPGVTPAAANPPAVNPPAVNPPAANPPGTNPPAANPPGTNPPAANPPAANPPAANPPAANPPGTNPPAGNPTQASVGPTPAQIMNMAPVYGAACLAVANSSSGGSK